MAWLIETGQKPKKIVANSSGNHAQAVAYAAQQFGIPATIFMPEYSSQVKIQATKGYGAEVVLSKTRDVTDELVREASKEEGTYWIPPFNMTRLFADRAQRLTKRSLSLKTLMRFLLPAEVAVLPRALMLLQKGCRQKQKSTVLNP